MKFLSILRQAYCAAFVLLGPALIAAENPNPDSNVGVAQPPSVTAQQVLQDIQNAALGRMLFNSSSPGSYVQYTVTDPFYFRALQDQRYQGSPNGVYFPLIPPALAEILPNSGSQPLPADYPTALTAFVGETFYLPYHALYRALPSTRTQRIDAYRLNRDELLAALRSKLEELKEVAGTAREKSLADFSKKQARALADLATEEEAIRVDLTAPGVFKTSVDSTGINVLPEAVAGGKLSLLDPGPQAVIKAAQLQEGLSTAQRLLLHEISIELQLPVEVRSGRYVFFWPATARIRLPANLSNEATAKLAEFQQLKTALKTELWDTVMHGQNFLVLGLRTAAYEKLAGEQAARFATLDGLAEEIRTGLAGMPYPDEPPLVNLPTELVGRISQTLARKAVLQRELASRLKEFRRDLPSDRIDLVRQGSGLAIAVRPPQDKALRAKPDRNASLARLQAFNNDISGRFAALGVELSTLRADIQQHRDNSRTDAKIDIDQLTVDFEKSYTTRETWNQYHNYYVAVLQPGLSPAQRRLLFDGALVDLQRERFKIEN